MRTLTLVAPAAGACGGDYTRYPSHRSLWMNVTCLTCGMGIVTPCTDSTSMPDTISQCCTADEGYTLIFVNSQSRLGTSKDAFVIDGIVDTAGWTNTSPEYDATGLNLKGDCKDRSHLTESDVHCMAECPGTRDVPVTLVDYVVEDHSTKRAIVDCDADKKSLLDGLRDDPAVKEYLDSVANYQARSRIPALRRLFPRLEDSREDLLTRVKRRQYRAERNGTAVPQPVPASDESRGLQYRVQRRAQRQFLNLYLRDPIDESLGRRTTTTAEVEVKKTSDDDDTVMFPSRTIVNNSREKSSRQRDGETVQKIARQRDGTTARQYRAHRNGTTVPQPPPAIDESRGRRTTTADLSDWSDDDKIEWIASIPSDESSVPRDESSVPIDESPRRRHTVEVGVNLSEDTTMFALWTAVKKVRETNLHNATVKRLQQLRDETPRPMRTTT